MEYITPYIVQELHKIMEFSRGSFVCFRMMIRKSDLPKYFYTNTINIVFHVLSRLEIRPIIEKKPCELLM